MRQILSRNEPVDIPADIKAGLENPDPKYIYDHKEAFCEDYTILDNAAKLDCVPIFALWMETKSKPVKTYDSPVDYYISVATGYNASKVIRYLSRHCVNINHIPPYEYSGTVLFDAVVGNHKEAALAIIEHPDIDLEMGNAKGVSPLSHAFGHSRPEIADMLIKAGAKLTEDIIISVCQGISKEAVNILVKHIKDLDFIYPKKGITLLHAAIAVRNTYAVKKLIELGVKTTIPSRKKYIRDGKTYPSKLDAMQYAEIKGDERTTEILTNPPEEPVMPILDYTLQAPLEEYRHFFPDTASESTLIKALTEWQKTRIDQERTDSLPKEIAIGLQNPDPRYVYDHMDIFCKEHLIMSSAAEHNCVPLFRLRFEKLQETAFFFDNKPIPVEFFINQATTFDSANIIRYLNPYVKNINYRTDDTNRCTCLHWAAQGGNQKAVEALLEHPDIDLEVSDCGGVTPLARAFYSHHAEIAELLLKAGAKFTEQIIVSVCLFHSSIGMDAIARHIKDVNFIELKKGITPLHAAIVIDNEYAVKELIKLGAKTDIPSRAKYTRDGKTYPAKINAIEYARIRGNEKINKILAER